MNSLKRLGVAIALTFVLGLSAFAGDVETPPCAPPAPGIISTPPCSSTQVAPNDPAAPGQPDTPPASNTVDILSVAEAAMNLMLLF